FVVIEIGLMVVFGGIKMPESFDFGNDGLVKSAAFIQGFFIIFSLFSLLFVVIVNTTTVLCSYIITLTVECGGIVCFAKNFKQLVVRDYGRIIHNLQGFCKSGSAGAYFFIGGLFIDMAIGIAAGHFFYTFYILKYSFCTPKTTIGKCGDLRFLF